MAFKPATLKSSTMKSFVDKFIASAKSHGVIVKRHQAQEMMAQTFGFSNWHDAQQSLKQNDLNKHDIVSHQTQDKKEALETTEWTLDQTLDINMRVKRFLNANHMVLGEHYLFYLKERERKPLIDACVQTKRPTFVLQGNYSFPYSHPDMQVIKEKDLSSLENWLIAKMGHDDFKSYFLTTFRKDVGDDIWARRAETLGEIVVDVVVDQSRKNLKPITIEMIKSTLRLESLILYYKILKNVECEDDIPLKIKLETYFQALPGFKPDQEKQPDTVLELHGYLQMQFTRTLGGLDTHSMEGGNQNICLRTTKNSSQSTVIALIDYWVEKNKGGYIVFDGINYDDERLWDYISKNMFLWEIKDHSLFFMASGKDDLPEDSGKRGRILSRIHRQMQSEY